MINRENLYKYLDMLNKKFYSIGNLSEFSKNFEKSLHLKDLFGFLGCCDDENCCFYNPYLFNKYENREKREEIRFIQAINTLNPYIIECGENYIRMLEEIEYIPFYFKNHYKIYSFDEVQELVLAFFFNFDEATFKIVKNFFENEDFELGKRLGMYDGICYFFVDLNKSFILLENRQFNLESITYLVHELGHYIEFFKFNLSQKRRSAFESEIFSELSSSFYEYEFLRYLKKNNFDIKATNDLLNIFYFNIKDNYEVYADIVEEEEDIFDLLDNSLINYVICSYFSIYLSELRKQDPKEFDRIFGILLSSYSIVSPSEILKLSEFDKTDFLNCESIRHIVEKDSDDIKRQYKINL